MDKQEQVIQLLNSQGLLPLFFDASLEVSLAVMEALYNGGVRIIEYTNRGAEALNNFEAMKAIADKKYPGLLLGAGTIKNAEQAIDFINAGADFLISPAFAAEIFNVAAANKILWIPGCMTPTEILAAENKGIKLVKLFPGNVLGPSFVQAVKDLFPAMQFMPTGGVDTTNENLKSWFGAGVCAVGMGSKLITAKILKDKNYPALTATMQVVLQVIQSLISPPEQDTKSIG